MGETVVAAGDVNAAPTVDEAGPAIWSSGASLASPGDDAVDSTGEPAGTGAGRAPRNRNRDCTETDEPPDVAVVGKLIWNGMFLASAAVGAAT